MASSRSQHATPLVNHLLCLLRGHRPEPLDILHRQDSLSQRFGCNGAGDYILDCIMEFNLAHGNKSIRTDFKRYKNTIVKVDGTTSKRWLSKGP